MTWRVDGRPDTISRDFTVGETVQGREAGLATLSNLPLAHLLLNPESDWETEDLEAAHGRLLGAAP